MTTECAHCHRSLTGARTYRTANGTPLCEPHWVDYMERAIAVVQEGP